MIASLLCSIYIIYLYRKLNPAEEPEATNGGNAASALQAEIATLNAKIDALETRLSHGRLLVTEP